MKETKVYSGVECDIYSCLTEGFVLDYKPLVTVSVTAYNSSKFILETLESIKAQTYHNLILQISDDSSNDNTIQVCKNWIDENQNRFYKTKIITPHSNTGVSANCNRAWDECETEWFKGIAGDDVLLPTCIDNAMNFVFEHPSTQVLFGRIQIFGCSEVTKQQFINTYLHNYEFIGWTKEEMKEHFLYRGNFLPAAAAFVNIKELRSLDIRHDERIPLLEDLPKWLNCLDKNVRFSFTDKELVSYRLHEASLSNGQVSKRYLKSQSLFYTLYVFPYKYKQKKISSLILYVKYYSIIKDEPLLLKIIVGFINVFLFLYNRLIKK